MPLRLAILSFWHVHARDYARQATEHPGTEITAVWDEDADRGRGWAADLNADFHQDLGRGAGPRPTWTRWSSPPPPPRT